MNIGERIRGLREQSGLSLRKLAESAKVSSSLISQIELAKVDPSLSTLRKIASALNVPLFFLVLENDRETTRLVRVKDRRKVVFPQSGLEYEIIHSDLRKKMGVHIGILQPGGATSDERMIHEGEECLIILEGSLKIELGEEDIRLEADDSLYFDSSIPHRLVNQGDRGCRFYLIITPPKF